MGIHGVFKALPKSRNLILWEYEPQVWKYLDVANALAAFGHNTKKDFLEGNYVPALKLFSALLLKIKNHKCLVTLVFDGGVYHPKDAERKRRDERDRKAHQSSQSADGGARRISDDNDTAADTSDGN